MSGASGWTAARSWPRCSPGGRRPGSRAPPPPGPGGRRPGQAQRPHRQVGDRAGPGRGSGRGRRRWRRPGRPCWSRPRDGGARDHVGVGDHQVAGDREAAAEQDPAAAPAAGGLGSARCTAAFVAAAGGAPETTGARRVANASGNPERSSRPRSWARAAGGRARRCRWSAGRWRSAPPARTATNARCSGSGDEPHGDGGDDGGHHRPADGVGPSSSARPAASGPGCRAGCRRRGRRRRPGRTRSPRSPAAAPAVGRDQQPRLGGRPPPGPATSSPR